MEKQIFFKVGESKQILSQLKEISYSVSKKVRVIKFLVSHMVCERVSVLAKVMLFQKICREIIPLQIFLKINY